MKPQISTSIDQSRRLLACGVDTKTADLVWLQAQPPFLTLNRGCNRATPEVGDVPAWSLSAAITLLPTNISIGKDKWWLDIAPLDSGRQWGIGYYSMDKPRAIKGLTHKADLMECTVEEIEWLTANNYPLTKIAIV